MSKRAEEAALKAYPEKMGMFHEADIHYEADLNKAARIKYIEGYEQAEKYTTHKVEKWLAEIHRVCDITDENGYRIELRDLTASLEKAMEEE